jgi:hypothetical protein
VIELPVMALQHFGKMLRLEKYSLGVGDRFAQQARAQLLAFEAAARAGVELVPVWNKSNREHLTVGSDAASVRKAADEAVRELKWKGAYHVDADHIRLETVDRFVASSDFFTIDVADSIAKPASEEEIKSFISRHPELLARITFDDLGTETLGGDVNREYAQRVARKYLAAVKEAGNIYRHIQKVKGDRFIAEVSMDETDAPQTPPELLIILIALADEKVPVQTIAPKFTGRFNKGVDYAGDVNQFEKEFNDDLTVIRHAVRTYGLPENLKLSVHSGSDKFSIYPAIRRALSRTGAGVHIKTAGTTWLEEVIGLAEAGGAGLDLAKEIYTEALDHLEELCAPYASVIDVDPKKLPSAQKVRGWSSDEFVRALRHNPKDPLFNPNFRQLLHVGYKIAAKKGERYLRLLRENEPVVARNVTANLFERHIKPLFID